MGFSLLQLVATMILGTASIASADVINFSLVGPGDFSSYTEQGVTFTANGGGQITSQDDGPTPNGTFGLIGVGGIFPTLRADIAGGASSASIDLGDFDSDPDLLFLQVYNASNILLDSASFLTTSGDQSMHTLTLADADIAYAIFGSTAPSLTGSSVYADNFTWSPSAAVPEPTSLIFLSTTLLALALTRKRIARGL